jgi:predicted Ser/Thr protein kinase
MNTSNNPSDPRLREIFLQAVEIAEPTARQHFLNEVCGNDVQLLAQVTALLASHKDDSFLERPAFQVEAQAPTGASPKKGNDKTIVLLRADASPSQPAQPSTLHYFGDYQLQDEIARGGMGVVYRARQVSLNRIVAVKMILAGKFVTSAEVKRFHTEAEAAANLQHPNIVAIHEIGEQDGRHYFSMDFVEGQDLAQAIGGEPMPAQKAAALLKTVAEAVHFAHQRGTLHRDLKPHNVLIDAAGQPRITDFGLAKRVEQASDLTQSGAVMGSPSYMPPEQAAGRQAEVGPASDVYSLGAILYQMLTGKAPFLGATAVDTLRQVIEQDPVAPSKLNDKVPSDLETICLKCLEKKPAQRYSSARALAEELERFLNHQPILAKPASTARKVVSWCRQRPWVLTGGAVFLVMGLIALAFGLWQKNELLQWRITHPKAEVPDFSEHFVFLMLAGYTLMIGSMFAISHWTQTKRRRSAPIPKWLTWFVNGSGCAQILISIAVALWSVRTLIWIEAGNDLRAVSIGWFSLSVAFAMCWTGVLAIWRFGRIDDVLGLGAGRNDEGTQFKLKINWVGVVLAVPVLLFVTPQLGRWLVEWGQFQPVPGFLPGAKSPVVFDAALRKVVNQAFVEMFALMSLPLALVVCFVMSFWKLPRQNSEWRDMALPLSFVAISFMLVFAVQMPKALAAAAVLWGLLAGFALLMLANLRRVELPKGADETANDWKRKINEPAVRRVLPWTWGGLVVCALLFVPGPIQKQAVHAILWICISMSWLFFAVFRLIPKSRREWKEWIITGVATVAFLYLFTDGFSHVRRFGALSDPKFLLGMFPALVAGFLLYRAARKPVPTSLNEIAQSPKRD